MSEQAREEAGFRGGGYNGSKVKDRVSTNKNVASGDHVRRRRMTVLTRRHDKVERRRGTARNGQGKDGLGTSGFSSTDRKRGA